MQRELTITIDEQVYEALYKIAGQQNISKFIEDLLRPRVLIADLDPRVKTLRAELEADYRAMAADEKREAEALDWIEGTIGDAFDETR